MTEAYPKIFIVGCSGSGKSTVARELSMKLGAELYELDFIAWEPGTGGLLLPYERRLEIATEMSQQRSWIVEGSYLGWTTPLMEHADVMVWMDVPLRTALWRVFRRHLMAEIRRDNRFPGWRRLFRFMRAVVAQYRNRPDHYRYYEPQDIPIGPDATRTELARFKDKVVIGSNDQVVVEVLQALSGADR